jgi:hypothetical protein
MATTILRRARRSSSVGSPDVLPQTRGIRLPGRQCIRSGDAEVDQKQRKSALESLMRFVVNPQQPLIECFNRASKSLLQLLAAPQQQLFECFGRQL